MLEKTSLHIAQRHKMLHDEAAEYSGATNLHNRPSQVAWVDGYAAKSAMWKE